MPRTILFWLHLTAGVIAGAIIFLMSVTGVLLTYEKQMLDWADMSQLKSINAPVSSHLTADSLIHIASAAKAGATPATITFRSDSSSPAQVSFGQAGVLYLNPATGVVLGPGSTVARGFFRGVTDWHRWLAGKDKNRELGKMVTGAANLLFLLLVLSGMMLWLPRTWTWLRVRAVLWFRGGLSGKARDFNWHNVLGIWTALPLVAIIASATVIGYPWASDLVYKVVGETPPPRNPGGPPQGAVAAGAGAARDGREAQPAGALANGGGARPADETPATASTTYAAALATALPLMPGWRAATVQIPKPGAKTLNVTLDRGTGGQPQYRATATIATATGTLDKYQPFDSLTTGRQLRSILRFTHTGEVLGLTGQTIAGLVSFSSVILVITGLMLAIRRAARAVGRRGKATESDVALGVPAD